MVIQIVSTFLGETLHITDLYICNFVQIYSTCVYLPFRRSESCNIFVHIFMAHNNVPIGWALTHWQQKKLQTRSTADLLQCAELATL